MARTDGAESAPVPTAFLAPGPESPASEAVRIALDAGVRRLFSALPDSQRGDVEGIHQTRVGTRRLRSDLRTFRPLLEPAWCESLRDELKWLGAKLGAVRDLDVLRDRLAAGAGPDREALAPLFETLTGDRDRAQVELIDALNSLRFAELKGRLLEAVRSPLLVAEAAQTPCATALPPLVASAWRHLARAGHRLDPEDDPAEDLHEVRIRAKRARYAAEAVAPSLGPDRGDDAWSFAHAAADIQDLLGDFHDAIVAAARIRELASAPGAAPAFREASERLADREDQDAQDARDAFPNLWHRLDRKKRRQWMKVD
jgi:CHAD domain-containing protein